ncbi:Large subunit ribosomal protein L37e [Abeliophyllum distichum]|uniref:Large subunit ribosomal protein L37e n=1 Tax=Abeliophyllum distichum TaxID=126358 RepID=A0ABD1Q355_9LAMI
MDTPTDAMTSFVPCEIVPSQQLRETYEPSTTSLVPPTDEVKTKGRPLSKVNLKPNCPIPPMACNWYICRDDIASEWESPYKARIEAFKKMIGTEDVNNSFLNEILLTGSSSTMACILVYYNVTPITGRSCLQSHGEGNREFGKRRNKTHTLCVRCGRCSFHIQKSRCSACAYLAVRKRTYKWSVKAIRIKTTGTGRMMYLCYVPRRFREGTQVAPGTMEQLLLLEGLSGFRFGGCPLLVLFIGISKH